jgi:3-oxoacyl-[acyl-carrier protein] reductase
MSLLEGKKALVTGGSGAVGRVICQVLAKEGADVAFNFNQNKQAAEEAVRMIEAEGAKALSYQVSVTDCQGIQQMVEDIFARRNFFRRM